MSRLRVAGVVPADPAEVVAWHGRLGAAERLVPPWSGARVEAGAALAEAGGRVTLALPRARMVLRCDSARPEGFAWVQEEGPLEALRLERRLGAVDGGCRVEDELTWEPAGRSDRMERALRFQHARLADDLARHASCGRDPLTVAVTGASGLVGRALVPFLTSGGHTVRPLVRGAAREGAIRWSPRDGSIDAEALEGVDAVVHLAGASIGGQRWTPAYKQEILRSRVDGTRLLSETLARLDRRPEVLVSASAVGFYGDTGPHRVTEDDGPGDTFLAEVCQAWEAATAPAREAGIRVVNLRTGIVLAADGGALGPMLPAARAGLGGPVGGGGQYLPVVARDDLVAMYHLAICDRRLSGPVNAVGPEPVTQRELARALGRVLGRPAVLPAPAAALRLALGREMADALILQGQRAMPDRLHRVAFRWSHPDLEEALRFELGV